MWQLVVLLICFLSTRPVFGRGVPFPGILPNQSPVENKGLYTDAEFVISMNGESLGSRVYNKDHATYLELYNSYCGFCKRFAPHWKAMSEELKNWRDIVHFGAIDCSRDENNDICREFNVLEYPTVSSLLISICKIQRCSNKDDRQDYFYLKNTFSYIL